MQIDQCSYEKLNFDEACVSLKSKINSTNLWLYTLSANCISCPYARIIKFENSKIPNIIVDSASSQHWKVIETVGDKDYISAANDDETYCQLSPNIGQYGIYELVVATNNHCSFNTNNGPTNPYTPLAIACGLIVLLLCSLSVLKFVRSCIKKRCTSRENAGTGENSREKWRMQSLDTVRGMSILLMIFVNNGAGGYPLLEHATWNGLTVGDLVFPCFMWIMGVCIPLSISSQLSRGSSRLSVCSAIVKRSLILFFIGLSLNTLGGKQQLENIRIFGVLQRFAVTYLVAALAYTLLFQIINRDLKHSGVKSIRDIVVLLPQWAIACLILAGHCCIIFFLPVPGCPRGYLGPGGRHADGKYLNCTGGASGYVDKVLLGVNHIYQLPTVNSVYGSGPFDPEGVLGCLTSTFQVFLGIQAGQVLRDYKDWKSRLLRWLLWALLLGLGGSALHFTNLIPVNKNLWSISFVMVTTCFSLGLLSTCYLLVDVGRVWEGGPFRIPGMNALAMYAGHQILYEMFPFHWKIGRMNSHGWLLAESLWCVGLWTCVAYLLHRKKLYLTL